MRVFSFSKEGTAEILRIMRKTKQWSQKELATKAGLSEASIKGYENGENVMSLEAAVKIANAFGVTPEMLVNTVEVAS